MQAKRAAAILCASAISIDTFCWAVALVTIMIQASAQLAAPKEIISSIFWGSVALGMTPFIAHKHLVDERKVVFTWVLTSTALYAFIAYCSAYGNQVILTNPATLIAMGTLFFMGYPATLSYASKQLGTRDRAGVVAGTAVPVAVAISGLLASLARSQSLEQNLFLALWVRAAALPPAVYIALTPPPQQRLEEERIEWRKALTYYLISLSVIWIVHPLMIARSMKTYIQHSPTAAATFFLFATASLPIAGYLMDEYGRKRVVAYSIMALGAAHSLLWGLTPENLTAMHIHAAASGTCWSILGVFYLVILANDLSPQEKLAHTYALVMAVFAGAITLSFIAEPILSPSPNIATYIETMMLFAAVGPLAIAPETLPEDIIRRKELMRYAKKAKKMVKRTSK